MRLSALSCFQYLNAFKLSFRFIDDLAFINNEFILKFLDPSQPRENSNPFWIYTLQIIQLKNTTKMSGKLTLSTTYLCTSIQLTKPFIGKYSTCLEWKKDKLPCKNVSYIFAHSNRPKNQSYNMCISQVLPILYSASNPVNAFLDLRKPIDLFHANGFRKKHLYRIVRNTLQTNTFLGIRFDVQVLINLFGGQ